MATKILLLEAPGFMQNFISFPEASVTPPAACRETWANLSAADSLLTLAPSSARFDPSLSEAFDKSAGSLACAYFQRAEDMQSSELGFLNEESRGFGAKAFLAKGSSIFTETFFNATGVGQRLDPVYRFARAKFAAGLSLDAWASLQALLFLALRELPSMGEAGTGERVDVQVGADDKRFVYSVRFDLKPGAFAILRRQPILELARACAGIIELRYVRDANKAEITVLFPLSARPSGCIEVHAVHGTSALETVDSAKDYSFQTFGAMPAHDAPEQRVLKAGGFKKKFSDRVASAVPEAPAEPVVVAADPAPSPAPKVMVSGSATLGKKETPAAAPVAAAAAPSHELEKKIALLGEQLNTLHGEITKKDSLIQQLKAKANEPVPSQAAEVNYDTGDNKMIGLEVELREKTLLIEKLSRDIEEIKDPSKRNVISGLKDNATEAMKQKFERAQKELEESQAREKEMLSVLDKAVVMKDEANKKLKDMETKLRAASGGKSSQAAMLEKQVEEQKRQNKELSKRVTALMDQLTAAGLKAA
ncbi:MAG: hypothetical protein EOP11_12400 [Proteobacteria bacterium]|nr:MAG: hypothetical protein EOP11_12400 [Pseudomonadota bacterium]